MFADRDALDGNLDGRRRSSCQPVTASSCSRSRRIWTAPSWCRLRRSCRSPATVTVQIRNITQAYDFLTTPITIDGGDFTSYTAGTPPVIDGLDGTVLVDKGDRVAIDVDAADGTAEGLGVMLTFAYP